MLLLRDLRPSICLLYPRCRLSNIVPILVRFLEYSTLSVRTVPDYYVKEIVPHGFFHPVLRIPASNVRIYSVK